MIRVDEFVYDWEDFKEFVKFCLEQEPEFEEFCEKLIKNSDKSEEQKNEDLGFYCDKEYDEDDRIRELMRFYSSELEDAYNDDILDYLGTDEGFVDARYVARHGWADYYGVR